MGNFCWLTGSFLTWKLTFDLPVFEMLATALVSGLVTGVTVFASMRLAERQTRLTLERATTTELRSVIADIAAGSQARFTDPDRAGELQIKAVAADSLIRTSKLPYADAAASWVDALGLYVWALKTNPRSFEGFPQPTGEDLVLREFGPGSKVSKRLAQWIVDSDTVGAALEEESARMKSYVEKWHKAEFLEHLRNDTRG